MSGLRVGESWQERRVVNAVANLCMAKRNAGVLAGWLGGVPPPRSRADRALGEIIGEIYVAITIVVLTLLLVSFVIGIGG